jgi:uncharacterized protein (DUF885 family)
MKLFLVGIVMLTTLLSCSTFKNQKRITALYKEYWEYSLKRNPIGATLRGDKRYNDQLPFPNEYLFQKDLSTYKNFKKRTLLIDSRDFSKQDQINRKLFLSMLDQYITSYELEDYYIQFGSRGGFHTWLTILPEYTPFHNLKDYTDYLSRLQKISSYFDANIEVANQALKKGYRYPRAPFKGFDQTVKMMIPKSAKESLFYKPFSKMDDKNISKTEQKRLQVLALKIIESDVTPSYKKFHQFWKKRIEPKMRRRVSVASYPHGKKLYINAVKNHTSLTLTPKEIHEIGLSEVKRIKSEMILLMRKVNFKGSLKSFIKDLRVNPRFYPKTKKELLALVRHHLDRMDKKLPLYFGRLPKSPYEIKEIPAYKAAKETTAYYMRPSPKVKRPGYYYVNTSQLDQRPLYEVEALSYHEAVPGHHLQIAIEQELKGIPKFRKNYNSTAFVEGWGLYSESLAKDMGFYQDSYSDFGRLTYEIWRACRLVVDTGLHAFNWSRTKAINYMVNNTALSRKNIEVEIDRYITTPGQALAYKLGELKIKELRLKAQKQLGNEFDMRVFHDIVLGRGSVPLNLLEDQVNEWLKN